MREQKSNYSINSIIDSVAGTLYRMAPRNRPRDIDKIMSYVIENAEKYCVDLTTDRYLYMTASEFRSWLDSTLMGCPKFCNLNLSQNEADSQISVDKSRPKFSLDSWKDDFIDLDAAIHIIYGRIMREQEAYDCFLCDNSDDTDTCLHCILHYRDCKNLYEQRNIPYCPDSYAGWCSASCPEGVVVCCKDCNKRDECSLDEKCDSSEFSNCSQYVINTERKNRDEET